MEGCRVAGPYLYDRLLLFQFTCALSQPGNGLILERSHLWNKTTVSNLKMGVVIRVEVNVHLLTADDLAGVR